MKHFLLLHNLDLEPALRRYLFSVRGVDREQIHLASNSILHRHYANLDTPAAFKLLSSSIERQLAEHVNLSSSDLVIHTDHISSHNLKKLNPLKPINTEEDCYQVVVAMLILAFPEVHWSIVQHEDSDVHALFSNAHWLLAKKQSRLLDAGWNNLFDISGLRNLVRENMHASYSLPLREKSAVSIDDEIDFALVHSYISYRNGFRCCPVHSARIMELTLAADGLLTPDLVLEDLVLSFGDRGDAFDRRLFDPGNSDFVVRQKRFPKLAHASFRRCISSADNQLKYGLSRSFYARLESTGTNSETRYLRKPCSGILILWRHSGLAQQVGNYYRSGLRGTQSPSAGHSVPERIPLIAHRLLSRAEALLESHASNLHACLSGVTMALDARELLGLNAATTFLKATAFIHEFEVQIECIFSGAPYNLDAESRVKEIDDTVKSVSANVEPADRWNRFSNILNSLMIRYRDRAQFDEEQVCLQKLRKNHRIIRTSDWDCCSKIFAGWIWLYAIAMVGSVKFFLWALVGWMLFFWVAFALLTKSNSFGEAVAKGLSSCFDSFLGFSMVDSWEQSQYPILFLMVNCVAVVFGIFHLGIFLAQVYAALARK